MPKELITFGHYALPLLNVQEGDKLGLDGYDGFFDQSLGGTKEGDRLGFLINLLDAVSLIEHDFLITEVVLVEGDSYAEVIVQDVATFEWFFQSLDVASSPYGLLIQEVRRIWNSISKMKRTNFKYRYHDLDNHFLTFEELKVVLEKGEIEVIRYWNLGARLYARLLENGQVRVATVFDNIPEGGYIYDIPKSDVAKYKSDIWQAYEDASSEEEQKYWQRVIKGPGGVA